MSNAVPKTSEISAIIISALEAEFNQRIPLLPKAFNRVLAKTLAAVFIIVYKYAGNSLLQQFVRFASNEETVVNGVTLRPLTELGRQFGVGDPVGATQAEHTANITVTTLTGTLPSGSQLLNADNGFVYLTIGDVLLDATTKEISIRASSDQAGGNGGGAAGNLELGAIVSFVSPPSNVANDAVVTGQTTTGADAEDTEVYRQRILDFTQKRPQGGAYADYEQWGEETAGIINVYPYTGDPGEVDVYSEATEASSGSADGIPTSAQLAAVKESIELNAGGRATRRPVNAYVNSYAITRTAFDVVVAGLVVDNETETKALITQAVEQYFTDREPYIAGLSIPPEKDKIAVTEVLGAVSNVVSASRGIFLNVTITQASIGVSLYQLGEGEKAKAATVTFA
jgi:uncharacterized phage protein gp47/JayE